MEYFQYPGSYHEVVGPCSRDCLKIFLSITQQVTPRYCRIEKRSRGVDQSMLSNGLGRILQRSFGGVVTSDSPISDSISGENML